MSLSSQPKVSRVAKSQIKQIVDSDVANVIKSNPNPKFGRGYKSRKGGRFPKFGRPVLGVNTASGRRQRRQGIQSLPIGGSFRESLKEVNGIQRAFMLPRESMPRRFGDYLATKETALTKLFTEDPINWSTAMGSQDHYHVFAFRHPVRALVFRDDNEASVNFQYSAIFDYNNSQQNHFTFTDDMLVTAEPMNPIALKAATTYQPHGLYLYPGEFEEENFIWADTGDIITLAFPAIVSGKSITAYIYKFQGNEVEFVADVTQNSVGLTTLTYTFIDNMYFSIRILHVGLTNTQVDFDLTGAGPVYCQRTINTLFEQLPALDTGRILSVSLHVQNTANELDRNGEVAGYQVPKNLEWQSFIQDYRKTSSASQAKTFEAPKGIYGFLRPTTITEFEYLNFVDTDPEYGYVSRTSFPLVTNSEYLTVAITAGVGASTSNTGRKFTIKVCHTFEFMSESQWFDKQEPPNNQKTVEEALVTMRAIPNWHENPSHIKDLMDAIFRTGRQVVRGIVDYGPNLIKAAQMFA